MRQRLVGSQHGWDPGPLPNFAEQCLRCVFVGLPGIRRIGPHGVINNLGRFFQFHVKSGFHEIDAFLHPLIAALADLRRFEFSRMIFLPAAAETLRDIDLRV